MDPDLDTVLDLYRLTLPSSVLPSMGTPIGSSTRRSNQSNRSNQGLILLSSPEYEALNIFNADLPPCPNPRRRKREVINDTDYSSFDEDEEDLLNRCNRFTCFVCSMHNAKQVVAALMMANPLFALALTFPGNTGITGRKISKRVNDFVSIARKKIPNLQISYTAEENPEYTGTHVHSFLHAGPNDRMITRRAIRDAVRRAPVGDVWHLERLDNPDATYFSYLFKSLIGEDDEVERFLELQGGSPDRRQIIRSSNDFWRDGATGPTLADRKTAERLVRNRARLEALNSRA